MMENVTAVLYSNTDFITDNVTVDEFLEAQNVVKKPMVIFCNLDTRETFGKFQIVAKDMKELTLMYEKKVFFTSSVPEGEVVRKHGAVFLGA